MIAFPSSVPMNVFFDKMRRAAGSPARDQLAAAVGLCAAHNCFIVSVVRHRLALLDDKNVFGALSDYCTDSFLPFEV